MRVRIVRVARGVGALGVAEAFREAAVDKLSVAIPADDDILGRDIAMHPA